VEKSFAEPLKKACQELFLLDDQQLFGTQEQKEELDTRWFGNSPRKILQFVGTELFRNNMDRLMPGLGNDFFIYRFKLWYQKELALNPNLRVVVSDVRFQNESDSIQKLGGIIIKLDRKSDSEDTHSSEKELLGITTYDYLINNNATLTDFESKLQNCLSDYLKKIEK
jgi:hypothetical protein